MNEGGRDAVVLVIADPVHEIDAIVDSLNRAHGITATVVWPERVVGEPVLPAFRPEDLVAPIRAYMAERDWACMTSSEVLSGLERDRYASALSYIRRLTPRKEWEKP